MRKNITGLLPWEHNDSSPEIKGINNFRGKSTV
jgi:hypothetical protein